MNNCDVCGEVKPTKKTLITYPEKIGNSHYWNICTNCEILSPEEKDDVRSRNFKYYIWCIIGWICWFLVWALIIGAIFGVLLL